MDYLSQWRYFIAIVESGGFSQASRDIHVPAVALSRYLKALEEHLDCQLIRRTTRRLELTTEGQLFFNRCKAVLKEIKDIEREVQSAAKNELFGDIILSAPSIFTKQWLLPKIKNFQKDYPHVRVKLIYMKSLASLIRDRIDILISSNYYNEASVYTKILYQQRRQIYASPHYIQLHGQPKTLEELKNHNCVTLEKNTEVTTWLFENGKQISISGNLIVASGSELVTAACLGFGLIYTIEEYVQQEIKNGLLVHIPLDEQGTIAQMYLYHKPILANKVLLKLLEYL